MTITLPPDAGMMALDFKITGDPVNDCVVCAINNQNLFTLPLKFAPDDTTSSTDMMDISAYAGQEVEILFGLTGGTSSGAELRVDGLRIISVPRLELTATRKATALGGNGGNGGNGANAADFELRWPASASGWQLEASESLATGTWQPVNPSAPGTTLAVEDGDLIYTPAVTVGQRYYHLRRR